MLWNNFHNSTTGVFRRLMAILIILFVIVSAGLEFLLLQHFHQHIGDEVEKKVDIVSSSMQTLIEEQAKGMDVALLPIVHNKITQEALQTKDKDALQTQWSDLFKNMQDNFKISHFTFFDEHHQVVLRLHDRERFGDTAKSYTLEEAHLKGKSSFGIELLPNAKIILSTVTPVLENGKLLGFVELGREVDTLVNSLHVNLGGHLAVIIHKSMVNQKEYEKRMRTEAQKEQWERFSSHVLSYNSLVYFPKAFEFIVNHDIYNSSFQKKYDGKVWFAHLKPLYDASGNSIGDLLILSDITQEHEAYDTFMMQSLFLGTILVGLVLGLIYILLRQANDKIEQQKSKIIEAEERLQELAKQSHTVFWEIDSKGKFLYVSSVAHEVFGYLPSELEGKLHIFDLYTKKERRSRIQRILALFGKEGSVVNLEDSLLSKDGKEVCVVTNSVPILNEDAKIIGFSGMSMNITERKIAERAQKEVFKSLQKIASRIPGVVYQYKLNADGSSCFPYASPNIFDVYHVLPSEIEKDASKVLKAVHPDDLENTVASISDSARNLSAWRHEYRVKFEDGQVRWLFGNALPERLSDGATLWHGFIDDITDRKLMENQLKALNKFLDKRVEEEMAIRIKIQEEQHIERQLLIQKSKLSSMGEMMGAIAHQWRQPLNALNINIQNLDDDFAEGMVDKPFIEAFIAKNRQTILFMSKTIDDFRNFFKIDKDKKEFSLLLALRETVSIQSIQFKNENIDIVISGEDSLLFGFKSEFQQVVLNIINNARDAILEQKIQNGRIELELRENALYISDNGNGISEEIIERIFEPYFTTKGQGEGTGIGLYMSKMIIEKNMGWKLEVRNKEIGAQFSIIFSKES